MLTQVMSALGVWNNLTPSYATALVFELEERQPDDFIVRVLYKNGSASNAKVGQQLHLLHIPGRLHLLHIPGRLRSAPHTR